MTNTFETLRWCGGTDGYLELIDQTALPSKCQTIRCHDHESVWHAIKTLQVRGAPAIGIAAAYGVVLALRDLEDTSVAACQTRLQTACDYLATSRPTAVNLFWALDRMRRCGQDANAASADDVRQRLLTEAQTLHDEDRTTCHAIGTHGADLLEDNMGVLTHCNAGALATAEFGTALAVIYAAHQQGKRIHVYADETRPLLQGARLTTWELKQHQVETTLICDSMAAQVMRERRVQAVITGADRIAANGDTANKIGTYGLAVLANHHGIPFYIAAPHSTFDLQLVDGSHIPIEQRAASEVTHIGNEQLAPEDIDVYNPAFDVTPAALIHAIITDRGIVQPVDAPHIAAILGAGSD